MAKAGYRYIRLDNRDVGLSQKWDGVMPDPKAVSAAVREGKKPDIPYTLADMAADAAGQLPDLDCPAGRVARQQIGAPSSGRLVVGVIGRLDADDAAVGSRVEAAIGGHLMQSWGPNLKGGLRRA